MFKDSKGFTHMYLACGYTDLRRGIDGLAAIVRNRFEKDPYETGSIFLFCGRRSDRIKALVYEGDGFLLMYKRLSNGRFQWPRNTSEALEISEEQFAWLMDGFEVIRKQTIHQISPKIY